LKKIKTIEAKGKFPEMQDARPRMAILWGERWEQEDFELAIPKKIAAEDNWGEPGYLEAAAA
jgi:hypothetical protein